jgi:arylsulfatase A-like enzyme
VHVPLIVKYPRSARRGVVAEPVGLVDVAPTILATLGLPPLGGVQGAPLWERSGPVISEEPAADGTVVRAVYDDAGHVLLARPGRVEWYDLATDPAQEHPRPVGDDDPGARLAATLETRLAGMSHAPRGPVPTRDAKLQERLHALGYVQ